MLLDQRSMVSLTVYYHVVGHVHAVVTEMPRKKRLIWHLIQTLLFGIDGKNP